MSDIATRLAEAGIEVTATTDPYGNPGATVRVDGAHKDDVTTVTHHEGQWRVTNSSRFLGYTSSLHPDVESVIANLKR